MISINIEDKNHLERIALNKDAQFIVMQEILIGYRDSMLTIKTILQDKNDNKFYMLWWERDLSGKGNHILEGKLYEVQKKLLTKEVYIPVK